MLQLIVVSDIHGWEGSNWHHRIKDLWEKKFDVNFLDSLELASLEKEKNREKEHIHQKFLNGGIDKAADKLISHTNKAAIVLGFSIGGLIAWKAAVRSNCFQHLIAISSTRLRFETQKPKLDLDLYFGENDPYKPDEVWFRTMKTSPHIIPNEGHDFYTLPNFLEILTERLQEKMALHSVQ